MQIQQTFKWSLKNIMQKIIVQRVFKHSDLISSKLKLYMHLCFLKLFLYRVSSIDSRGDGGGLSPQDQYAVERKRLGK